MTLRDFAGKFIREERKKAKLTQKQLGERIGVSGAMIAQYENGLRKPKIETLKRIADAIGIPVDNLIVQTGTYVGMDGNSYPERTSWDDVFDDIMDDIAKHMTDEGLKKEIDICFEKLDITGKRELFKIAVSLCRTHTRKEED